MGGSWALAWLEFLLREALRDGAFLDWLRLFCFIVVLWADFLG